LNKGVSAYSYPSLQMPQPPVISSIPLASSEEINWEWIDLYYDRVDPWMPLIPRALLPKILPNESIFFLYNLYAFGLMYQSDAKMKEKSMQFFESCKSMLVKAIEVKSLSMVVALTLHSGYSTCKFFPSHF